MTPVSRRPGRPNVRLTQALEETIRRGHPWIYADAVRHGQRHMEAGQVVDVLDREGEFLARGVIEPDSPLRVRVWTLRDEVEVDEALLRARIKAAKRRRHLPDALTTGARLLHGAGDRTPGLTCDLYGEVAVLRPDGLAAERRWLEPARRVLSELFPIKGWVVRRSALYAGEGRPVAEWLKRPEGRAEGDVVEFLEHGLRYECDVIAGQKTGFFLDMRANRQRVAALSTGKRVLNLFGYTGGFSLASAAAGAAMTTTVDLAAPAIAQAKRHFEINGLWHAGHDFVVSDVFDFLARFEPQSAPFELAVCDPPSFAHKRRDLERARAAYVRLFGSLMKVMPTGSALALGSCSSHIGREAFLSIVAEAALEARCELVVIGCHGADDDHPTLPGFPEGDYLQCVFATLHRD